MWKEKVLLARDFVVKKSKYIFPVIVIAVVAMTVTLALNAGNAQEEIAEVNRTQVEIQEVLSNSLYYYSLKKRQIEIL